MERNRTEIIISWASLWRIFLILILVSALFVIRDILIILLLAIVTSSAFDGPVNYLEKKGIGRIWGTLAIFLFVLAFLSFVLYTIIPISILEINGFLSNLGDKSIPVFGSFDITDWVQKMSNTLTVFADSLFSGGFSFFGLITEIFGNIILIITTIIIVFYLTVSKSGVENFLKAILPINYEDQVVDIYLRVRKKMGMWLQGQLILMFVIGSLVFLGLWIMKIKYSLILGILAALLEIVPIVGPIITGVLVFMVAISYSWIYALYSILLVFGIQQLENYLIVPVIMKKTVGISPVMVIISILIGAKLAGIVGIILAVPVAVVFQEIFADWEKKKGKAREAKLKI